MNENGSIDHKQLNTNVFQNYDSKDVEKLTSPYFGSVATDLSPATKLHDDLSPSNNSFIESHSPTNTYRLYSNDDYKSDYGNNNSSNITPGTCNLDNTNNQFLELNSLLSLYPNNLLNSSNNNSQLKYQSYPFNSFNSTQCYSNLYNNQLSNMCMNSLPFDINNKMVQITNLYYYQYLQMFSQLPIIKNMLNTIGSNSNTDFSFPYLISTANQNQPIYNFMDFNSLIPKLSPTTNSFDNNNKIKREETNLFGNTYIKPEKKLHVSRKKIDKSCAICTVCGAIRTSQWRFLTIKVDNNYNNIGSNSIESVNNSDKEINNVNINNKDNNDVLSETNKDITRKCVCCNACYMKYDRNRPRYRNGKKDPPSIQFYLGKI